MAAGGSTPGVLDHVAMLHRGPDELADLVAVDLAAAVDRGEAVLASLPPESWATLEDRLGAAAARVRWLDAEDRYATPAGAMTQLHRFVVDALDAGAPAVWSLGALRFDGSAADDAWARYEHAVNAVLTDVPLHAVCAFDLANTPAPALGCALASHERVHGAGLAQVVLEHAVPPLAIVGVPAGAPLLDLDVDTARTARAATADVLAGAVPEDTIERLRLVVSELATNALRHGRPPVRLLLWRTERDVVVQVRDDGPGISDPFAELRPPRPGSGGGRGLNIVAQLARLHFEIGGRSVVTAAMALP